MPALLWVGLGVMAMVLLMQPQHQLGAAGAQTSGTVPIAPGVLYELVSIAPLTTGSSDWRQPNNQLALRNDLVSKGAAAVEFTPAGDSTIITVRQAFPKGGSIPIGTVLFSNAVLQSVRRLSA